MFDWFVRVSKFSTADTEKVTVTNDGGVFVNTCLHSSVCN